jgi:hypothetical protein
MLVVRQGPQDDAVQALPAASMDKPLRRLHGWIFNKNQGDKGKMKIPEFMFFLFLSAGIVIWFFALRRAFFFGIDESEIFYLLLGGQLVKLGYSYGDATDEMSWRESVSEAFKNLRDKK